MATYTDVFERKEIKYRLSSCQHQAMVASLGGIMVPDVYGHTPIVSLYLDTPDRSLVARSLEKPLYKEKLRMRSYGVPRENDRVFIEVKKKFDGIVYKRRVGLSYAAARAYLGGVPYERACAQYPLPDQDMAQESLLPGSSQIAREIDRFIFQHGPLCASMTIFCRRTAYVCVDAFEQENSEDGLRITFDEAIAYQDLLSPGEESTWKPLLGKEEAVMEVKSAGPFPLWLVRALDECRAYPSSFSKYGKAYQACSDNSEANIPYTMHAHDKSCADGGIFERRRDGLEPSHSRDVDFESNRAFPFSVRSMRKEGGNA